MATTAVALYDYAAAADGDLTLKEGDVVVVTESSGACEIGNLLLPSCVPPRCAALA